MSLAKRKELVIAVVVIVVVAVIAALVFVLTKDSDEKEATPITFTEFNAAGPTSVRTNDSPLWNSPQQLVIRSASDWTIKDLPFDSLRSVDFAQSMIVVYAPGQQNSGGHTVAVTGVTGDEKKITVAVLETAPGANCATTQALTAPKAMVQLPTSAAEVAFDVKKETKDC
jgi:hypothetical protein